MVTGPDSSNFDMQKNSRILLVGHNDIIENGLFDCLKKNSYSEVVSISRIGLNPSIQPSVYEFFQDQRPEYVFLGSVRSGGIQANQKSPAEFLYHNLEAQNNIIYSSWKFGVKKLLYIGASCVYPKDCAQPMKEEYFLTGPLEETSEAYSVAKIAGIKMCQAYKKQYGFNAIAMIPATVYGPGSDTDFESAHVLGALLAKFHQAVQEKKDEVVVWGSGSARREFLYIDDAIEAALFLMDKYEENKMINAGCGEDIPIADLASMMAQVTGFKGKIAFDKTKPDGATRKFLDSSRLTKMGWKPKVKLMKGIEQTYHWFKQSRSRS